MKIRILKTKSIENHQERGITIFVVAISLLVFLGAAALAIDISHLYLVKNELQNAADSGALAGARVLFDEEANVNATEVYNRAEEAAEYNKALAEGGALDVEVVVDQNIGDVKIGHWSFGLGTTDRGFTPYEGALPTKPVPEDLLSEYDDQLSQIPTKILDQDTRFINAVQVTARRNAFPVASFFARIFGIEDFKMSATATAYLGFAGSVFPGEVDQPIAMCENAVSDGCKSGTMMNGGKEDDANTAAWVDFVQPCEGAADASAVKGLVCAGGNPDPIVFGVNMSGNDGVMTSAADKLVTCWAPWKNANLSFPMTLPVIKCPPSNCVELVGVIDMQLLWINEATDPKWTDVPLNMAITNPKYYQGDLPDEDNISPDYSEEEDGPPTSNEWTCQAAKDFEENPPLDKKGNQIYISDKTNEIAINTRKKCWNEFVDFYELKGGSGKYPYIEADYTDDYGSKPENYDNYITNNLFYTKNDLQKTIFFLPTCDYQDPTGDTGGKNFGVLAKIPKLVQ